MLVGDDTDRFDEEKGAEIVAYVYDARPGGNETCNCGRGIQSSRHPRRAPLAAPTTVPAAGVALTPHAFASEVVHVDSVLRTKEAHFEIAATAAGSCIDGALSRT